MANLGAAADTGAECTAEPPPTAGAGVNTGVRGTVHTMSPVKHTPPVVALKTLTVAAE